MIDNERFMKEMLGDLRTLEVTAKLVDAQMEACLHSRILPALAELKERWNELRDAEVPFEEGFPRNEIEMEAELLPSMLSSCRRDAQVIKENRAETRAQFLEVIITGLRGLIHTLGDGLEYRCEQEGEQKAGTRVRLSARGIFLKDIAGAICFRMHPMENPDPFLKDAFVFYGEAIAKFPRYFSQKHFRLVEGGGDLFVELTGENSAGRRAPRDRKKAKRILAKTENPLPK